MVWVEAPPLLPEGELEAGTVSVVDSVVLVTVSVMLAVVDSVVLVTVSVMLAVVVVVVLS